MRIVFLGSPQFAVPSLEALHHSSHEIAAVVTQPDRPKGRKLQMQPPAVKIAAERYRLPILQPATTKSEAFFEEVRMFRPDILVVVAYGEILRSNFRALPQFGAVNLHASLLPKFRGAAPIPWAMLSGESRTGATTMMMNEVMDAGPILLQQECPITSSDTAETLSNKISKMGAGLLIRTIDLIGKKEITAVPQDPTLVSFAPKLKKENGRIDWNQNAIRLSRQIRAFDPWPGSFTTFRKMMVKIWSARAVEGKTSEPPGTVIEVARDTLRIACGEQNLLEVLELQVENRRRSPASDFTHGYSVLPGNRFETPFENDKINF
jgi:methionyl-tRNA formyltransferase